jgi:hypothetical protein
LAWEKQGLLIPPPTHLRWVTSHAAVPFADAEVEDDQWVYFTARDELDRSQIARARLGQDGTGLIANVADDPVLLPGRLGTFDDSGVMSSCLVREGSRQLLYYQGWSLGVTVPFYVFIGCAVSEDGGRTFVRVSEAPIVGRSETDPILTASPWVLIESGHWRMWYVSAAGWSPRGQGQHYYVHIRHAESDDGIHWRSDQEVAVDFKGDGEYAVGRPCVVRDQDCYRMWYAHRGASYRIGYAESPDGLSWTRRDDATLAAIAPSSSGWDSEMVEYGTVFDRGGARYMLYNGNGFGETGTGYAVWRGS